MGVLGIEGGRQATDDVEKGALQFLVNAAVLAVIEEDLPGQRQRPGIAGREGAGAAEAQGHHPQSTRLAQSGHQQALRICRLGLGQALLGEVKQVAVGLSYRLQPRPAKSSHQLAGIFSLPILSVGSTPQPLQQRAMSAWTDWRTAFRSSFIWSAA